MKRTALAALHEARGAHWTQYQGWEIPSCYCGVEQEYLALQEGVGLLDLSYRSLMRVTGRDRRTWLHGQVTQDVKNLPDGRGAYAAIMTPKGRMVTDARVFALPDALLVDVPPGTEEPVAQYLDRFLIMERAEITDLSDSWALLSLQGPLSCQAVAAVLGEEALDLPPWGIIQDTFDGEPVYVARAFHCGEDGFDLFVPATHAPTLWACLCEHRPAFAVHSVGFDALNVRRTEAGLPWWGHELSPSIVPLEARLESAIHFNKGCYVGQEIIARITARGHVNNLLAGFLVQGEGLPAAGAEIRHEGKKVGSITTALRSLRLERPIALGYLRREHQEPGTLLETESGQALKVTALPFVPHDFPSEG